MKAIDQLGLMAVVEAENTGSPPVVTEVCGAAAEDLSCEGGACGANDVPFPALLADTGGAATAHRDDEAREGSWIARALASDDEEDDDVDRWEDDGGPSRPAPAESGVRVVQRDLRDEGAQLRNESSNDDLAARLKKALAEPFDDDLAAPAADDIHEPFEEEEGPPTERDPVSVERVMEVVQSTEKFPATVRSAAVGGER